MTFSKMAFCRIVFIRPSFAFVTFSRMTFSRMTLIKMAIRNVIKKKVIQKNVILQNDVWRMLFSKFSLNVMAFWRITFAAFYSADSEEWYLSESIWRTAFSIIAFTRITLRWMTFSTMMISRIIFIGIIDYCLLWRHHNHMCRDILALTKDKVELYWCYL